MVRSHHESWDGQGYPDHLAGEEIPILARVLQVADCYDAMSTDRPYQPAMSQQEVLAHFGEYSGRRYDPSVIEALCAVIARDGVQEAIPALADEPVEERVSKTPARAAN
jgi:response regulator RpfG family c-di-GMP phosphodiesterase